MPLEVTRHDEDGHATLVAAGALDLTTAGALEREVLRAEADAVGELHLDLRGVHFFDSTGLQIVLDAHVRAQGRGRRLVVVAGETEARRVLELAEVTGHLDLR